MGESKPALGASVAKWVGLQLAAKAFSLALGLPIVAALITSGLAWAEGLPLLWGFLAVLVSVAAVSTALNQLRTLTIGHSAEAKFRLVDVEASAARVDDDGTGYGVILKFENVADFPIEYKIERWNAHLERSVVVGTHTPGAVFDVDPHTERQFGLGVAAMPLRPLATLLGEVNITVCHGKPGKLNYQRDFSFILVVHTDPNGHVWKADLNTQS